MGDSGKLAIPALLIRLSDSDEKVRWYSAFAISELDCDDPDAIPILIKALHDPDDDVCGYAAKALGKFGAQAKEALPDLEWLTESENPELVRQIEDAIIMITLQT